MSFDYTETVDILKRTPAVLDHLLRGIGAFWHAADEGPETWSPIVIVGHLVHGEEADWIPRARIILEHGEARAFDPFDREAQFEKYADWPLETLLDRFAELREQNLQTLEGWNLGDAQLALPGRHPDLGRVTLAELLATWAVHDLGHLAQISRVMAKVYRDEVGAWRAYIPILDREPT